jgi:hypothetical protein
VWTKLEKGTEEAQVRPYGPAACGEEESIGACMRQPAPPPISSSSTEGSSPGPSPRTARRCHVNPVACMALAASPSEQAGPLVAARASVYVQLNIATFPATSMHCFSSVQYRNQGPFAACFLRYVILRGHSKSISNRPPIFLSHKTRVEDPVFTFHRPKTRPS